MRLIAIILAGGALATIVGCWAAAIPRYKELPRAATAEDLVGLWMLSHESLETLRVDGVVPPKEQKLTILLNRDGSCSYETITGRGTYLNRKGQWKLDYRSTESFKNRLDFYFDDQVLSVTHVALDAEKLILWESWGDPDAGIDLVYLKEKPNQTSEPTAPSGRGSP